MAGSNGQMTIGAARTTAGFMNNPAFERKVFLQGRLRSGVFGGLSKKIGSTFGEISGTEKTENITKTAAFVRVEKREGDTHNFTMQKILTGPPTFGDRIPQTAGTLGFLHSEVVLHKVRSPAFQVPAEMDRIRVAGSADINYESAIRDQEAAWHGEATGHDSIIASLKGASDNLLRTQAEGARAIDLGRGAGVQVSPMNALVRGVGMVTGATLAAREADFKSKIGSLSTATPGCLISLSAIQELNEEVSTGNTPMIGLEMGGSEMFYLVLPSVCRLQIQGQNSTMVDYAKFTAMWGKDSPLLKMNPIQVGNIVVLYDNYLSKYSPDVTGSEIIWGKDTTEFQSWGYKDLSAAQLTRGVGLLYGQRAVLEATNGTVEFMSEEGKFKTSKEMSSMVKRSMVRSMWTDKQDSAALPKEYGCMAFVFSHNGIKHGT